MVTAARLTLDEFLKLPETEPPSEFVCGRIEQKPMPTWNHSRLAARLSFFLEAYFMAHAEGFANVELRHASASEGRAYIPDISVSSAGTAPRSLAERRSGAVEQLPDIAIEIVSPDDRPGRVADKLAFYLRSGVPLVWIVDPEDRSVSIFEPGKPVRMLGSEDILDAKPVLTEFTLPVDSLFSVLYEGLEG